jgi:membrane-associated protein
MFVVGFLVALGKINPFALVLVIGANTAIAFLYYTVAFKAKQKFFMNSTKLKKAQKFFKLHGKSSVFLSRLLPTLRVYISFVAGIAHMDKKHFLLYTLYGYTLLNVLWFSTGFLSHLVVKDITQVDTQNFTLYSTALFFIFLLLYLSSKFIIKRFLK